MAFHHTRMFWYLQLGVTNIKTKLIFRLRRLLTAAWEPRALFARPLCLNMISDCWNTVWHLIGPWSPLKASHWPILLHTVSSWSALSFLCSWAWGGGRSSEECRVRSEINNAEKRGRRRRGQTNWFQLYSTQIQTISREIRTIATPLFIWIEHSNENETFNWQFKVVESNQKFYRSLKSVFFKKKLNTLNMNTLKGSISWVKFLFRAKNVSIACSREYWWWPHVSSHTVMVSMVTSEPVSRMSWGVWVWSL